MKIEEYNKNLNLIFTMNDNIVECRTLIKDQKRFNKTMVKIYGFFLIVGIVGLILKQFIPLWLYIICWVLVGFNAIAFLVELIPNHKYESELAGSVLGEEKKAKYDKDLNDLSNLIKKENNIDYDDLDEKNNIVFDKLNVSEKKYYYSNNDYIEYSSFEPIKNLSLDLEEYK